MSNEVFNLSNLNIKDCFSVIKDNEYREAIYTYEGVTYKWYMKHLFFLHNVENSVLSVDESCWEIDKIGFPYAICPLQGEITFTNNTVEGIEFEEVYWQKFIVDKEANTIDIGWYTFTIWSYTRIKKAPSNYLGNNYVYRWILFKDVYTNWIVQSSNEDDLVADVRNWEFVPKGIKYKWGYTRKGWGESVIEYNNETYLTLDIDFYWLVIENWVAYWTINCPICWVLHRNNSTCQCKRLDSYHSTWDVDLSWGSKCKIGIEIEKDELIWNHPKYKSLWWGCEQDGSVKAEYITPILDIDKAYDWIVETGLPIVDGKVSKNCWGHMNISRVWYSPKDLYGYIKFYRPLLWALYPKRALNSFCHRTWSPDSKYTDFSIKSNRVEVRIFPWLKGKKTLKFRIELCKFMLMNPVNSIEEAFEKLLSDDFYDVFSLVYSKSMITAMKRIAEQYAIFSSRREEDFKEVNDKILSFLTTKKSNNN